MARLWETRLLAAALAIGGLRRVGRGQGSPVAVAVCWVAAIVGDTITQGGLGGGCGGGDVSLKHETWIRPLIGPRRLFFLAVRF